MKKRILAVSLALTMAFSLAACGGQKTDTPAGTSTSKSETSVSKSESKTGSVDEISLWTYPIGKWGSEAEVNAMTAKFTEKTGIKVKVEYLAYEDGDDKVNAAITAKNTPDLIMEGPERLVANWGANGKMVDLSDIITADDKAQINEACMTACTSTDGKIYEYPLVMTAHCMAINKTAFEEADALQYVDLDTHTWTTENFIKAVDALYKKYGQTVGAVYCAGQGGDQGTRALVNNMYGGTFTNAEHTAYTWDDEKNVKALEQLKSMEGLAFDASLAGGDEIAKFYQGTLKMAFCWNIAQQLDPNGAGTGAEKTVTGDDIAFMSFPSETGESKLCGGIWGFGIFDNGDQAKIDAAKEFIKFMCNSSATVDAVKTAKYFAVREKTADGTDLSKIWADEPIMDQYNVLMPMLGDYYQVTPGWAQARTSWWTMLQKVGEGSDIKEMVAQYAKEASDAAK